ncbi:MAG: SipW-dependent-type signal peptide-containing protein [Candidatus Excrementavichristensenella sp.]|jgi:predicted ribosomally synthesized peptide with SipW-like signal peptide
MDMEIQNDPIRKPGRRDVALIAALVCCIAIAAAGTLAYFTAEETAYNVIAIGNLDMVLREETTGGAPFPEGGIDGVLPGAQVDKVVYVENAGSVDFYCRLGVEKVIELADPSHEPDPDAVTLDINTADWTEKDGFYHYKKALRPGEKTTPLFRKVKLGRDMGNEYMDAHIEINVLAQAVQSKNNAAGPLSAVGWPTT